MPAYKKPTLTEEQLGALSPLECALLETKHWKLYREASPFGRRIIEALHEKYGDHASLQTVLATARAARGGKLDPKWFYQQMRGLAPTPLEDETIYAIAQSLDIDGSDLLRLYKGGSPEDTQEKDDIAYIVNVLRATPDPEYRALMVESVAGLHKQWRRRRGSRAREVKPRQEEIAV